MLINGDIQVREKIFKRGSASLSDCELLQAVLAGTGIKNEDLPQVARDLNAVIQRIGHENITIEDILPIKGVGEAKAALIFASFEFWSRKLTKQTTPLIDSPEAAAKELDFIRNKRQEHFVVLTLNGARRLIKTHVVTIGTLMTSLVHPREVFALAIEDRAASIIIGHNHPSGALIISEQDRDVSRTIKQAGEIIGIRLDDHIVVTEDGFTSAM